MLNILAKSKSRFVLDFCASHMESGTMHNLLLNYFAKMLSVPQSYMESNSASIDIHSNAICNAEFRLA